jgi:hypothetical protein
MKKRLVTYLLVSALAAAVFAGCSKKDGGDAADAAATDAAVVEEAAEAATASLEDVAAAAEAADAEEAGNVADTTVAAEVADAEVEAAADDASVTEFVDEEVKEDAVKEDADKKDAEEAEVLVVDPGTTYTVRFGGNIYSSPEENAANVMYYANPGDYLTIVERLDNYWYKVSYYLAGEGIEHIGYIQIQ